MLYSIEFRIIIIEKVIFMKVMNDDLYGGKIMAKYQCKMCGYVYDEAKGDPDNGIPAGTKWEDLPANYACPVCASPKGQFKKVEED